MDKGCDNCAHFYDDSVCKQCKWNYVDRFEEKEEKLKPCPFCGEEPKIGCFCGAYKITCSNIRCQVAVITAGAVKRSEAIKQWNRRARNDT